MKSFYSLLAFALCSFHFSMAQAIDTTRFGKQAWAESVIPIHPGIPGKTAFWNANAHQFIYAPAFDYHTVDKATAYRFTLVSETNDQAYRFESKVPYAPLSRIWASVPIGYFHLSVAGISSQGDSVGLAGGGRYYRAAPFNGVYHEPALPYDSSARLALDRLMHADYVNYWLEHKTPKWDYINYSYPAKIYSALVIGAITHAKLKAGTEEAKRSTEIARTVADYMLSIRFKEGTPWEYFVPTYYGPRSEKAKKEHLRPINSFSIMGVDAGNAFLDLYDFTGDQKYFEAARHIAQTYLKNQLANGSWYQFVNHETGEPTAKNIVIPTSIINYFDRLQRDYKVQGLEAATQKALAWIMNNPVKTFDWQGQFEDIAARPPYGNLSREQACDLAMYLFRNKKNEDLAEELVRFSEDQFVIWEQPVKIAFQDPKPGGRSENWITPSVQEQYVFWMPVGRSAGVMMQTFLEAYKTTGKTIYLAKAQSIANSFTLAQQAHNGDYPTYFTKYPLNLWLNSTVYPAKLLMNYNELLEKKETYSIK
jgi:maltose/maltodextrin transport system substrate-binding protein